MNRVQQCRDLPLGAEHDIQRGHYSNHKLRPWSHHHEMTQVILRHQCCCADNGLIGGDDANPHALHQGGDDAVQCDPVHKRLHHISRCHDSIDALVVNDEHAVLMCQEQNPQGILHCACWLQGEDVVAILHNVLHLLGLGVNLIMLQAVPDLGAAHGLHHIDGGEDAASALSRLTDHNVVAGGFPRDHVLHHALGHRCQRV
mmetsp:Transcript_51140/g.110982  ORF Transcript_51140/g.110982 Transcript_51140/m.110982 type:complete len:201 (+) Transcript_51140:1225-1827(+)